MSFSSLFKKASNLLGLGSPEKLKPPPLDGEIIYCKNNVCVHPPAALSRETTHYPGYLNIRSQGDQVLGATLILTWIPNATLQKNPRSIENSPNRPGVSPRVSPRRSPRQEFARVDFPDPNGSNGSDTNQDSPTSREVSQDMLSGSLKSQTDSGIGSIEPDESSDNLKNNIKSFADKKSRQAGVGQNVNNLHNQDSNVKRVNTERVRAESDSGSTSSSEGGATSRNRQMEKVKGLVKERTGSNRSVTSIEMDGDNLVVVTEEVEDATFVDDLPKSGGEGSGGDDPSSSQSGESVSLSSDSTYPSPTSDRYHKMLLELTSKNQSNNDESVNDVTKRTPLKDIDKLKGSMELKLELNTPSQPIMVNTPDISITGSHESMSSSSTPTSGPDSFPATPPSYPGSPTHGFYQRDLPESPSSPEMSHNMSFPNNSVSYASSPGMRNLTAKEQVMGVFSVDLGQMRSLRIFYSDDNCTCGQLVIASRESQYKILHFHHGGLDRLAEVFSDWKFLAQPKERKGREADLHCKQFSVIRPHLTEDQVHPEEGAYEMVNEETWHQHMNENGQIEDNFQLRKAIFFAGLDASLRHEMWPFLLHYYPYNSTHEEREHIRNDRYISYQNIRKQRESMNEEDREKFWKTIQCTVEKDVVRTDRSHPYFKGEDNPNIEVLKYILLNYAVAHPHYGYTQGMSDLLAPVLAEVQNETDAYWCFVGLMQKTIFVSSPKDVDMDKQLIYLRELLRLMLPRFYKHLEKVQDGLELLFCHRWILLCFKREFQEIDALKMWEACWSHFQTDYFHLFICVAIISVYGEDVVQQDLPADEMLLHFSSLSMHMSGSVILRKARGLLYHFRLLKRIPCTLDGLCTLCGTGMWDSGHVPTVECVGNHEDDLCPFGGKVPTHKASPKPSPKPNHKH